MEMKGSKNIAKPVEQLKLSEQKHKADNSISAEKRLHGKYYISDDKKTQGVNKLPRAVRGAAQELNKSVGKTICEMDSGDAFASTSKPASRDPKTKNFERPLKTKPSSIPRRKLNAKENPQKSIALTKKTSQEQLRAEARNIQRVQLLINSDFYQDGRKETTSVVSARPIPTLGQIYGNNNAIESDRLNDWLARMSLETPANSIATNARDIHLRISNDIDNSRRDIVNVDFACSCVDNSAIVFNNTKRFRNIFRRTDQNVSDWLSSEFDSIRDYSSGYRFPSAHSRSEVDLKGIHCNNMSNTRIDTTYCVGNYFELNEKSAGFIKVVRNAEQPTIVIINPEDIDEVSDMTDLNINKRCSSKGKNENIRYTPQNKHGSSYVDFPSEELQKTTNFDDEGCVTSKTTSSMAGTDLEVRDEGSSRWETMGQRKNCNIPEDQLSEEWKLVCGTLESKNLVDTTESSEESTLSEFWRSIGYEHRDCWKTGNYRHKYESKYSYLSGRFKNHRRVKAFPSERYRLSSRFDTLKNQFRIRICRRRWNHIWKKTAERWALWSKSPTKAKKIRMMHYLQRSIIWKDADVQTTTLVYAETGTDSILKEQKSTAISGLLKLTSNPQVDKTDNDIANTSENKFVKSRADLGPSMFPFFYNPKRKSLPFEKSKGTAACVAPFFSSYDQHRNITSYNIKSELVEKLASIDNTQSHRICEDTSQQIPLNIKYPKTSIALEPIAMARVEAVLTDSYTQMKVYKHAATEMSYLSTFPTCSLNSSGIVSSGSDISYCKSGGSKTGIEIHPTPFIRTSSSIRASDSKFKKETSAYSIGKSGYPVENKQPVIVVQALSQEETLTCTKPEIISISSAVLKSTSAVTSQHFRNTETITDERTRKDCECVTTPSLYNPCCYNMGVVSGGNLRKVSSYVISLKEEKDLQSKDIHDKTEKSPMNLSEVRNVAGVTQFRSLGLESSTDDVNTNISLHINNKIDTSAQSHEKFGSFYSTYIGCSGLLSVCTLNKSLEDISTQTAHEYKYADEALQFSCIPNATSSSTEWPLVPSNDITNVASTEVGNILECICAKCSCDDESNTDVDESKDLESPAQTTSFLHQSQREPEVIVSDCTPSCSKKESPKTYNVINERLTSDLRLIKRKSSTEIPENCESSEALFSDLNAEKWMKRGTFVEKNYNYFENDKTLKIEEFEALSTPESLKITETNKQGEDTVTSTLPTVTLAMDSLTDILPRLALSRPSDSDLGAKNKIMINQLTSDKAMPKDLKEFILQASPEICHTATGYMEEGNRRTASVLTSRYYIPPPIPCTTNNAFGDELSDCVFVYSKPRCCIHKHKSNVAIQMTPSQIDREFATKQQSDGQSLGFASSYSTLPVCCPKKHSDCVAEVLSPRVYRALYETTKLMLREDSERFPLVKQTVLNACTVNTDDHSPEGQLAKTLTSEIVKHNIYVNRSTEADVDLKKTQVQSAAAFTSVIMNIDNATELDVDLHKTEVQSAAALTSVILNVDNSTELDVDLQKPEVQSAAAFTSGIIKHSSYVDNFTEPDNDFQSYNMGPTTDGYTQTSSRCLPTLNSLPTDDSRCLEECVKSYLVSSCRHYSDLLSKQINRVRENLAKHLPPYIDPYEDISSIPLIEAGTMKPSACQSLSCQTSRIQGCFVRKTISCVLSSASSVTEICKYDKENLKSVYYILAAIEGRVRRLKGNLPK